MNPDNRARVRPPPFREASVVRVGVREQDRLQLGPFATEGRHRLCELVPAARDTRVDQEQLLSILDQVEV